MTRRDAHVHLSGQAAFSAVLDPVDELATYERSRDDEGIADALVVGYERHGHAGNNAEIRELARTRPWMHPLAFLETRARPDPELLRVACGVGFAGWAVYLDAAGFRLWRSDELAALGADGAGLLSVNVAACDLGRLAEGLRQLADVPVLVSHLGLPGSAGDVTALLALADDPRVHVKVSGLYAIDPSPGHDGAREATSRVLDAFGPRRMHWGSDFAPVLDAVPDAFAVPDWLPRLAGDSSDLILGDALGLLLTERAASG